MSSKRKSTENIRIRELCAADIDTLFEAFARHKWDKPKELFARYLHEQSAGKRQIWVAWVKEEPVGYVTLTWFSHYQPFLENSVPEIMDLNVLPPFRRQGIGSKLLDEAEKAGAQKSPVVGIGVGLYDGYGDAQKLYVKRGYIPDGLGPTYRYIKLVYGQSVNVDDDLVMWFTKRISQ